MVDPAHRRVKGFTLCLCEFQLKFRGLTGAIGAGEGASTPWGTTTGLVQVGEDREGDLVAKWDVDDAMVGECAHSCDGGGLLATTLSASRDEEAGVSDEIKLASVPQRVEDS